MPWTERALAAGKHVLCEKPIALDAEEAQRADRGARRIGQAASPRRSWCASIRNGGARREIARSGGDRRGSARSRRFSPIACSTPKTSATSRRAAAALYDIGCYAILTARYVFGAEPTRVVAALDVDPNFGTDRLASALIEFPGGRHLTFTLRDPDRRTISG